MAHKTFASEERKPSESKQKNKEQAGDQPAEKKEDEKRFRSKRPWLRSIMIFVGIGLVATIGFYSWHYWTYGRYFQSTKQMIPSLEARIAQAEAAVEQGQAQLRQAQIDLEDTVIISPIAGRIGDLTVRIGQYVSSGTRMMDLVPIQDLYLEANYKETQIGLMRVGQPAFIKVDALPQEELNGMVASISPGTGSEFSIIPSQNATGNFTKIVQRVAVRIKIDAGPAARKVLLAGLSVEVRVDTRSAKEFVEREEQEDKRAKEKPEGK